MAKRWTFDEGRSEENTLCLASAALGPWSPRPFPILWLSKATCLTRAVTVSGDALEPAPSGSAQASAQGKEASPDDRSCCLDTPQASRGL
jgi:hypothetical protein